MSSNDDQLDNGPKIAPAHDEIASFHRGSARGSFAASLGEVPDVKGGPSGVMKTILTVVVLVLLATAAMAGFMYQKLVYAEKSIRLYETRIGDLEKRLSVTDESMSESSDAIKEKTREMDSEIRKLWDNVWKKSKERFAEYDVKLASHDKSIANSDKFIVSSKLLQSKNSQVFADLGKQLEKVKSTQNTVQANQRKLERHESNIETVSDKVNRTNSSIANLEIRVKETEEWVESINGFRRQLNRDIIELKKKVGQMQMSAQ